MATNKTYRQLVLEFAHKPLDVSDEEFIKIEKSIPQGYVESFREQAKRCEQNDQVSDDKPIPAVNANKPSQISSGVINSVPGYVLGIVFLVLAVILYFVSVDNNYGVANIQTTVFSAASFVASIVSFAAARIIDAVNSK